MTCTQRLFAHAAWIAVLLTQCASSSAQPPTDRTRQQMADARARHEFAPMWMPVKFFQALADPNANLSTPSGTAYLGLIKEAARVQAIELSPAQQESLAAIDTAVIATATERSEQFKQLSPAEQAAEVESWGDKQAPWRDELDKETADKVDAVLTPEQIDAVRKFAFPMHAVSLLYDAEVRQAIDFDAAQQDQLRKIIRARLEKFQTEFLDRADRMWDLLTPAQQAALPELVKKQGPTSAALSLAYHVGFDFSTPWIGYPLLIEAPVRARLGLSADQEADFQALAKEARSAMPPLDDDPLSPGARQRAEEADKVRNELHAVYKERIDALLTPEQLAELKEIDFRRAVVLALGYAEKRAAAGITEDDLAKLRQVDAETLANLQQIDREMLDQALQVLTSAQQEQLRVKMAERLNWD